MIHFRAAKYNPNHDKAGRFSTATGGTWVNGPGDMVGGVWLPSLEGRSDRSVNEAMTGFAKAWAARHPAPQAKAKPKQLMSDLPPVVRGILNFLAGA